MKQTARKLIEWLKKSHPLFLSLSVLLLALGAVAVAVFLAIGYRFAIYQNISPDWDAIGTVFSFFASIGAIGAAILIPWRIAQQQNKIALFDMKFEFYSEIMKFICLSNNLEGKRFTKHQSKRMHISKAFDAMAKPTAILFSMAIIFGFQYDESATQNDRIQLFLSEIKRSEHLICRSLFFFPYIENQIVENIISTCRDYIFYVINVSHDPTLLAVTGGNDETARAFIEACGEFSPELKLKIEKDLFFS